MKLISAYMTPSFVNLINQWVRWVRAQLALPHWLNINGMDGNKAPLKSPELKWIQFKVQFNSSSVQVQSWTKTSLKRAKLTLSVCSYISKNRKKWKEKPTYKGLQKKYFVCSWLQKKNFVFFAKNKLCISFSTYEKRKYFVSVYFEERTS